MKIIEIPESTVPYLSESDVMAYEGSAPYMVNVCVEALLDSVGVKSIPYNDSRQLTLSNSSFKNEINRSIIRMESNKVLTSRPFASRMVTEKQNKAVMAKSLPPEALKQSKFTIPLDPIFLEIKGGESAYSADEFAKIPDPMMEVMDRYARMVARSCVKSKLPITCTASIKHKMKRNGSQGSIHVTSLRSIYANLLSDDTPTPAVASVERELSLRFISCYWSPIPDLRSSFELNAEGGESFDQFYTRTTGKDPYSNINEVWVGNTNDSLSGVIVQGYPSGDNDLFHPLPGHEDFLCLEKAILAVPVMSKIFSTLLRKGSYELSAFDFRAGEGFSDVVENIGV